MHCTQTAGSANVFRPCILHVAQTVNTVQLQHCMPQKHGLFQVYNCEWDRGSTVVKVFCYKSEGRWFDSRLCNCNFTLT